MNEKVKVILMGSREFTGRSGTKFASLSLLDVEHGRFVLSSVPTTMLVDAGIEGPSMTQVILAELEDNGLSKKIVAFEKTDETYTINTIS